MYKKRLLLPFILILFAFILTGCTIFDNTSTHEVQQLLQDEGTKSQQETVKKSETDSLTINYIDVGQGDSIFVQTPSGKTILIDAGTPEMGSKVVNYIKSRGINKIDILIGTHPHNDHIGGIVEVIKTFKIVKFYMPKVTTTTRTFEEVLKAAKSKDFR
ncbi:putative hydrolase (metallo-beta-lactamase superfamily) [Thermoanaerobacter thermohydrosulfuricus WC1]|uniref:Putative hydrolase (Metallo-beta-lactamase superfamily) n=1 Tax=Thermoanaerobacter thermohydrosulfuricus WC1 TaxID=1198630 RepID=M8DHP4_THETY|nr:MBL fold metallo-hydrolase [Thermoanaerobacter thermohydrosulfuricus]EMT39592.1 putative hydrolase (metallo-beta-lactamase superfamily) [Thermoanaerobacter thermohydrosulfuricus WC1]